MAESAVSSDLFTAAKQLADSEIELIKTIENSSVCQRSVTNMFASVKKTKKSGKSRNVRPSAALLAAKRQVAQRQLSEKKSNNFVKDIYQRALDTYRMTRKGTGLVFDRSMAEHECLWDPNYSECPARFTRVLQRCEDLGLVQRCKLIEPRLATESEILTKHSQKQIDVLKATDGCTDSENLELLSSKYDCVFFHPSTYKLSLLAAGSAINLVESICKGEVQNGMAIIRPPGHHAMESEYCGYCFFNNVAIAATAALNSNLASRILIVDWDVHHGQATQQMFYNDPRVVYFSIHRYEHGEFWPNLRESDFHYVGENLGEGYNFNVPLNKTGMTNADYIAIFQQVLLPMAYEFQPNLVIVSAGYDAALGCPEFSPDLVLISAGYDAAIGDEKVKILSRSSPSVISYHRIEQDHEMDWEGVRIIDSERAYTKRLTSEMINIKRQIHGLNKQDDTELLPDCYTPILKLMPSL